MFSLGSTRVVFWYCVVISKIVLFSVYFVCFETILYFVDVLDKGCGVINVQLYVGCCVFDMVKSYLCLSVPVLDDECGAFVHFVYDDSIIDDELFQGLSLFIC